MLEESDRQIDRHLDVTVLISEIAPIIDHLADHKLRKRAQVGIAVIRNEICWRDDPPSWVTDANERLGAAQKQCARVDFRLVPQFEPARARRFDDIDRRARRQFAGQQRGDAVTQAPYAERRGELG